MITLSMFCLFFSRQIKIRTTAALPKKLTINARPQQGWQNVPWSENVWLCQNLAYDCIPRVVLLQNDPGPKKKKHALDVQMRLQTPKRYFIRPLCPWRFLSKSYIKVYSCSRCPFQNEVRNIIPDGEMFNSNTPPSVCVIKNLEDPDNCRVVKWKPETSPW